MVNKGATHQTRRAAMCLYLKKLVTFRSGAATRRYYLVMVLSTEWPGVFGNESGDGAQRYYANACANWEEVEAACTQHVHQGITLMHAAQGSMLD